jgi:hypothetical protein
MEADILTDHIFFSIRIVSDIDEFHIHILYESFVMRMCSSISRTLHRYEFFFLYIESL